MRKALSLMVLLCAAGAAHADTVYSFSGLQWGWPLQKVKDQLEASKMPLSSKVGTKLCRAKTYCTLRFKGASQGTVTLLDDALVGVTVAGSADAFDARATELRGKFGPEQGPAAPSKKGGKPGLRWSAPDGEALELSAAGNVIYSAPPPPQAIRPPQ